MMQLTKLKPSDSVADRLTRIRAVVTDDLIAVDRLIIQELSSDIQLIQEITQHILQGGGKRLRPLVVLLCARASGYQPGIEHQELAAIIEFVHTATLLHDDVVDESKLRRGRQTANAIWGNQASVLVGDFLYSRAFQLLTQRSNVPIMKILATTTNAIAEGEVMQLMNRHDTTLTEDGYFAVIYRKTAKLFESAAEAGAILGSQNRAFQTNMAKFGLNLGLAFQIIDDVLDYTAKSTVIGKNIGDDLMEGKMTLPLIYALNQVNAADAAIIHQAIQQGSTPNLSPILQIIEASGAFDYCLKTAYHYGNLALAALSDMPNNPYKEALHELVHFAIERSY